MKVAQLDPWSALHREAQAAMLAHLLRREGSTFALRRAVAQQTGAMPLYGDMGGFLVLSADGALRVVGHDAADQPEMDRWCVDRPAELRQWLEYAWRESQALLPMAFQSLRITYVQPLPAPDSP
jgi:hypothetical protein